MANKTEKELPVFACVQDSDCRDLDTYPDNQTYVWGSSVPISLTDAILNTSKPNPNAPATCSGPFPFGNCVIYDYQCEPLANVTDVISASNALCKIDADELPPVENEVPDVAQCGDGVVNQASEQCDLGSQNGQQCDPAYNSSCTYCTATCKIETLDSEYQCGNGIVDVGYEVCDYADGGNVVNVYGDSPETCGLFGYPNAQTCSKNDLKCSDKGNYTCINTCQTLINQCVDCGRFADKPIPKIRILNPLSELLPFQNDTTPTTLDDPTQFGVDIYRKDSLQNNWLIDYTQVKNDIIQKNLLINETNTNGSTDGIETNALCKDEYAIFFNHTDLRESVGTNILSSQNINENFATNNMSKYAHAFDYPVNNQQQEVVNDYVYSPAVPPGVFRVVVKWTKG